MNGDKPGVGGDAYEDADPLAGSGIEQDNYSEAERAAKRTQLALLKRDRDEFFRWVEASRS